MGEEFYSSIKLVNLSRLELEINALSFSWAFIESLLTQESNFPVSVTICCDDTNEN